MWREKVQRVLSAAKVMKYGTDTDPTGLLSKEPAASFTHYTENNIVSVGGGSRWAD